MSRSRVGVAALIGPLLLVVSGALAGCLGPAAPAYSPTADAPVTSLYVVRHGWHTRIAVRQADVDPADWPESRDLGAVAWLEVGWGDRDYYPEPHPSIWDAVDAVIRPTPAALHVGGFDRPPPEFLADAPMVRVPVSVRGAERLAQFVHAHYERQGGRPIRIRPGDHDPSWFYLATGRYHAVFNNSNTWVARALRATGVPVVLSRAMTAAGVMAQAQRFSTGAAAHARRASPPAGIGFASARTSNEVSAIGSIMASQSPPTATLALEPGTVTVSKPALADERLGLFPADAFRLTTGRCDDCPVPAAALWYFRDELIAVPRPGQPVAVADGASPGGAPDVLPLPVVVWIAAPEIIERARLLRNTEVLAEGSGRMPLAIVPKIPANRAYVDDSTFAFLGRRLLRLRGWTVPGERRSSFVARTIWPEDWRLEAAALLLDPLHPPEDLGGLVRAQVPGVERAFVPRLLWERGGSGSRPWAGHPVLALVLSGAQGDDDGALAGHLAVATGLLGPRGEWADWLVNNFYPLDEVSEKGIVSAAVPMDNYLLDLNSGQAYYRPVSLLVAVLREAGAARRVQAALQETFYRYYCHEFRFDRAALNSTEMTLETLRAVGWSVPRLGATSHLRAPLAFTVAAIGRGSLRKGKEAFDFFREERTNLFPRVAFEVAGHDLMQIVEDRATRGLTPYERALQRDVHAILFVRVPQIPSSRPFGGPPVGSIQEYRERVQGRPEGQGEPAPRPFPPGLAESCRPSADARPPAPSPR